jgi:hypothetical protein
MESVLTDYQIRCIRKNDGGIITQVGIGEQIYLVENLVNHINQNRGDNFYTIKDGEKAWISARQHPLSHRWFLTTEPDNTDENNLDFLDSC